MVQLLKADILIVGPDGLGAINESRLVVEALESRGLSPLGVILSAPPTADASTGSNARTLKKHVGIERVIAVPRFHTPRYAVPAVRDAVDWILLG